MGPSSNQGYPVSGPHTLEGRTYTETERCGRLKKGSMRIEREHQPERHIEDRYEKSNFSTR